MHAHFDPFLVCSFCSLFPFKPLCLLIPLTEVQNLAFSDMKLPFAKLSSTHSFYCWITNILTTVYIFTCSESLEISVYLTQAKRWWCEMSLPGIERGNVHTGSAQAHCHLHKYVQWGTVTVKILLPKALQAHRLKQHTKHYLYTNYTQNSGTQ